MIQNLNEECFFAICEYLNLTDHLRLSQVCQYLQYMISIKFRRKRVSKTLKNKCWKKSIRRFEIPKYVCYLMNNTNDSIECDTDKITEHRKALVGLEFDRVKTLTLAVDKIQKAQSKNLQSLITNLFPSLKKLVVLNNFVETRYFYLPNVEEFDICSTPGSGIWHMMKICKLRKVTFRETINPSDYRLLTTFVELFELKMQKAHFDKMIEEVEFERHSNLRLLNLSTAWYDREVIIPFYKFPRYIHALYFHAPSTHITRAYNINVIYRYADKPRLKHLTIANDDGRILKSFCEFDVRFWNTLEEIFYLKTGEENIKEKKSFLLYMVSRCPKLKILDISNTPLDNNFFEYLAVVLKSKNRSQPVLLRCFNSKILISSNCSYLEITLDEVKYNLPDENEMGIELRDSKDTRLQKVRENVEIYREKDSKFFAEAEEVFNNLKQDFDTVEHIQADIDCYKRIYGTHFLSQDLKDLAIAKYNKARNDLTTNAENSYSKYHAYTKKYKTERKL